MVIVETEMRGFTDMREIDLRVDSEIDDSY